MLKNKKPKKKELDLIALWPQTHSDLTTPQFLLQWMIRTPISQGQCQNTAGN